MYPKPRRAAVEMYTVAMFTKGCVGWQTNLQAVNIGGTTLAISTFTAGDTHACVILVLSLKWRAGSYALRRAPGPAQDLLGINLTPSPLKGYRVQLSFVG